MSVDLWVDAARKNNLSVNFCGVVHSCEGYLVRMTMDKPHKNPVDSLFVPGNLMLEFTITGPTDIKPYGGYTGLGLAGVWPQHVKRLAMVTA